MTVFGKIARYIWDYSFRFVLVSALMAAVVERIGKVHRYVSRCLGFQMKETIDEAEAQKESYNNLVEKIK